MEFDKEHKVKWWLLEEPEARAFILFLESEKLRHQEDVEMISHLVTEVKHWYKLEDE